MTDFPQQIMVTEYREGDTMAPDEPADGPAYYATHTKLEDIPADQPVAIYELREVKTKRVTHALE
jgi:hypothetical protein